MTLQAKMSKLMSDIREYVRVTTDNPAEDPRRSNEQAGKSEKQSWYPGMYKGMNALAEYGVR